jgi:hypothetical protein
MYQRKRSISNLNETFFEDFNPFKDEVNNFLKESTAI